MDLQSQMGTFSANSVLPSGSFDFQSVEGFATYDSDLSNHNLMFGDVDTFQTLGTFDTNYSSGNLGYNSSPQALE